MIYEYYKVVASRDETMYIQKAITGFNAPKYKVFTINDETGAWDIFPAELSHLRDPHTKADKTLIMKVTATYPEPPHMYKTETIAVIYEPTIFKEFSQITEQEFLTVLGVI